MYEKSAMLGNPKAMMSLGRIHELGIGTKIDIAMAVQFYESAV